MIADFQPGSSCSYTFDRPMTALTAYTPASLPYWLCTYSGYVTLYGSSHTHHASAGSPKPSDSSAGQASSSLT